MYIYIYIPVSLEFQVILSGCIITISENPRLKHTFSRSKIWRILVDLNAFCLSRNQHPHTTYLPWSKVGIQVTIARIPIINMAWMTIGQIQCFDNGMAKWVWCRSAPFLWVGRWKLPKSIWMSSWSWFAPQEWPVSWVQHDPMLGLFDSSTTLFDSTILLVALCNYRYCSEVGVNSTECCRSENIPFWRLIVQEGLPQ